MPHRSILHQLPKIGDLILRGQAVQNVNARPVHSDEKDFWARMRPPACREKVGSRAEKQAKATKNKYLRFILTKSPESSDR